MCGSSPTVTTPAAVPEAPRTPDAGSSQAATGADKRRRAAAAGESGRSTILTSSRGVSESSATATKTLLGQ